MNIYLKYKFDLNLIFNKKIKILYACLSLLFNPFSQEEDPNFRLRNGASNLLK